MVGAGHDTIKTSDDGKLVTKLTNQVEAQFYQDVFRCGAPRTTPYPIKEAYESLKKYLPRYYGATGSTITIDNICRGFTARHRMDVKIGHASVSQKELLAGGMSAVAAWVKKRKLAVVDSYLKSSDRGFRIVSVDDAGNDGPVFRASDGGARTRTATGRADPKAMIDQYFGEFVGLRIEARDRLLGLKTALTSPQFQGSHGPIFIGASILFCYDRRNPESKLRIKLIDFAHSYISSSGMVARVNQQKHYHGFIDGLTQLINSMW